MIRMTSIVFEVLCTLTITSRSIRRTRNVSTKDVEKIETFILFGIQYMPFMIQCGKMLYRVRQATYSSIIRRRGYIIYSCQIIQA